MVIHSRFKTYWIACLSTEDDIIELFRQFIGDVEVNSMEELLEALAIETTHKAPKQGP